ncbi:unnamed protein product [Arctia plantaginis]|uniref:Uncharacterized protein n=1 Tax=Arctia plantaginis TaxID=874455 RepID=A0A8S0ZK35_ARCPL|nr:unnamed protein product [Arctia plantaginis]CAB3238346.1 unnamed protein product [Arctia plantaginis]
MFRDITTSSPVRATLNENGLEENTIDTEEINNTKFFSTTCEYNCGRPLTWISTASTTNTRPVTHNERNSDGEEKKEATSTTSSITKPCTTSNLIPETNTVAELLLTTHNRNPINTPKTTNASVTAFNNPSKFSSINTFSDNAGSEFNNIIDPSTDSEPVSKPKPTNIVKLTLAFEPTICNNCRRPRTWVTRQRKTRRLKYHGYRF